MKKIVFSNLFALLCLLCFLAHPLLADKELSGSIDDSRTNFYPLCKCIPPANKFEPGESADPNKSIELETHYYILSSECETYRPIKKCSEKTCQIEEIVTEWVTIHDDVVNFDDMNFGSSLIFAWTLSSKIIDKNCSQLF